jgi:hypothetical protein
VRVPKNEEAVMALPLSDDALTFAWPEEVMTVAQVAPSCA